MSEQKQCDNQGELFEIRRDIKQSERLALKTIQYYRDKGILTGADSAICDLVVRAARSVDEITSDDAASGRAAILKTYLAVLQALNERVKETNIGNVETSESERVLKLVTSNA